MNNKLLRKLTLSAVTLGVAAISATTSTFAWFTTNGTVSASTVSGTVKSSDILALIKSPTGWNGTTPKYDGTYALDTTSKTFTSSSTAAATFAKSTTLVSEGANDNGNMQPVAISGAAKADNVGSFTKAATSANTFDESTTAKDLVHYQFVIALSSLDKTKTYNVSMTLPALSQTPSSQYLLANAGTNDSAKAGSTLTLKIEDALSIGVKNTIVKDTNVKDTNKSTYGIATATTGPSSLGSDATGNYHAITETGANDAKGDAIAYYNNVYGLTGDSAIKLPDSYATNYNSSAWYTTTSEATAKTIYSITGVTEAVVATDLYFFIDGWDYQCFNAIGGLSLFNASAEITFAVEAQSQS